MVLFAGQGGAICEKQWPRPQVAARAAAAPPYGQRHGSAPGVPPETNLNGRTHVVADG